jgi:hypothetical protein
MIDRQIVHRKRAIFGERRLQGYNVDAAIPKMTASRIGADQAIFHRPWRPILNLNDLDRARLPYE